MASEQTRLNVHGIQGQVTMYRAGKRTSYAEVTIKAKAPSPEKAKGELITVRKPL